MPTKATMKKTMEHMLQNFGHSVKVNIVKDGYTVTLSMPDRVIMILKYPATLTPGDVVFAVRHVLDRLNGKV